MSHQAEASHTQGQALRSLTQWAQRLQQGSQAVPVEAPQSQPGLQPLDLKVLGAQMSHGQGLPQLRMVLVGVPHFQRLHCGWGAQFPSLGPLGGLHGECLHA